MAELEGGLRTAPSAGLRSYLRDLGAFADFLDGGRDDVPPAEAVRLNETLREMLERVEVSPARAQGVWFEPSRVVVRWRSSIRVEQLFACESVHNLQILHFRPPSVSPGRLLSMADDQDTSANSSEDDDIVPETKRKRFVRVAERRTNAALYRIRVLSNCANRYNYEYTQRDVDAIFDAIEREVAAARLKFEKSTRPKFSLG